MNNKIQLITTTSSVEGWVIEKYFGVVTYQLVVGANLFHDVFSSFRDVFGGASKSYQKDLQGMEAVALDNLKKKAAQLGGNLILGLRLDFDEVSGGGKSMFMLSASGTAALGSPNKDQTTDEQNELISHDKLDYEMMRDRVLEKVHSDSYVISNTQDFEELLKYNIDAVEKAISYYDKYLEYITETDESDEMQDMFSEYFQNISKELIDSFLKSPEFLLIKKALLKKIINLLDLINWFDYDVIFSLLDSDNPVAHNRALYLLELQKNYYSIDDISKLKSLIEKVDSTYKVYPVLQKSKGVFGKEKEEWECLNCGTKNSKEVDVCSKYECSANIYGIPKNKINPEELKILFKKRIKKLEQLLIL